MTVKNDGFGVRIPSGNIFENCWRVPNRTKHLSSAPVSFRLSALSPNDPLPIETKSLTSYK